jgi:DNA polymerase delta subunit 2
LYTGEDKYVVFISGVNAGSSLSNPLQFQLLVDHITGHLGDEKVFAVSWFFFFLRLVCCLSCLKFLTEQEQGIAAEIVHVVIAGNSVEIPLGLLNGQVRVLYFSCLLYPVAVLKFSFSIFVLSFHKMLCAIIFVFFCLCEIV